MNEENQPRVTLAFTFLYVHLRTTNVFLCKKQNIHIYWSDKQVFTHLQ